MHITTELHMHLQKIIQYNINIGHTPERNLSEREAFTNTCVGWDSIVTHLCYLGPGTIGEVFNNGSLA
jgi:hypothetical protein